MHGGSEVTSTSVFPFAVFLLTYQPEQLPNHVADSGKVRICTGSLITPHWVLSAAHCFVVSGRNELGVKTLAPDLTEIRAHYLHNNQTGEDFYYSSPAQRVMIHPDYIYKIRNDLSLVMSSLQFPILPDVHPINLANISFTKFYESCRDQGQQPSCTIVGYGEKYPKDTMSYVALHTMRIEALPSYRCPFRLIFLILRTDPICFVAHFGSGPCMGDSGGPLICDNQLTGILSRGIFHESCGGGIEPLVIYEDIANYHSWISSYTKQNISNHPMAHRISATRVLSNVFSLNLDAFFGRGNSAGKCVARMWMVVLNGLIYILYYYLV